MRFCATQSLIPWKKLDHFKNTTKQTVPAETAKLFEWEAMSCSATSFYCSARFPVQSLLFQLGNCHTGLKDAHPLFSYLHNFSVTRFSHCDRKHLMLTLKNTQFVTLEKFTLIPTQVWVLFF